MNNELQQFNNNWISAHLYYAEPWDTFLESAVNPFVYLVQSEKLAKSWFFIRYWEKGPHIRLRFYGHNALLNEKLKLKLKEHFALYMEKFPSCRSPQWEKNIEQNQGYPNNSIQFMPYHPEYERYGGVKEIRISEYQFEASSEVVLAALSESKNYIYEKVLGIAIQLHLALCHAFDLNRENMVFLFNSYHQNWLHRATPKPVINNSVTIKKFELKFHEQKHVLGNFCAKFLEALDDNQTFEPIWMNQWISKMKQVNLQLLKNKKANSEFPLFSIYKSYIHMTNNRLGLHNADESYLSYLIAKSIKC